MTDEARFAPGEYFYDYMISDYANKLGVNEGDVEDFIKGTIKVDRKLANKLEKATLINSKMWINLQKAYDEGTKESIGIDSKRFKEAIKR